MPVEIPARAYLIERPSISAVATVPMYGNESLVIIRCGFIVRNIVWMLESLIVTRFADDGLY
jgi:hypothetical protein